MVDREMMLLQARQDFLDVHKDLAAGKAVTVEHYDRLAGDVQTMDADHFEFILEFAEKNEGIPYQSMHRAIQSYIEDAKKSGGWRVKKKERLRWENGELTVVLKSASE
jgi:hypothetical protein